MSKKDVNSLFNDLKNDNKILLSYLKAKFPLFHKSNLFVRDFEYGIKGFLEKKGIYLSFREVGKLSLLLSDYYEKQGIFIRTNAQGWTLNYPEFTTAKPGDPFLF